MNKNHPDSLYAEPLGHIKGFSFDEHVVAVFPDMLRRSVPGYQTIITQTGLLAGKYATHNSHLYDLGCSLGATSLSMVQNVQGKNCTLVALDNSPPMIEQCQTQLAPLMGDTQLHCECTDITLASISQASVVSLNFTLQFVAPEKRAPLIQTIYDGLLPGGCLVLSEKINFEDEDQQHLHTQMYHEFKRANGYSDLEISQKRTALENVLITNTLPEHFKRLKEAGFSSYEVWFQCFNFVSIIALKDKEQ